jgi:hypothetical protein
MYKIFRVLVALQLFVLSCVHAQEWSPNPANLFQEINRTGFTGIGFTSETVALANASFPAGTKRAQFIVNGTGTNGGILAHYVSGNIGNFASKWCGLGEGNPGNLFGLPNPYGLSIVDNNSVGFLNLFPEPNTTRKDLVLGFGISGGPNTNRFVLRGYSGPSASTPKDLLVANPGGATGINAEPLSTFWVDARLDNATPFRDIAIINRQAFGQGGSIQTTSGIGQQANTSLTSSGIAVEGFRAQIPDFQTTATAPPASLFGTAVNLQTVRSPFGGPNASLVTDFASSQNVNANSEYAELSWQDLNAGLPVSVNDCATFPLDSAQAYDKFFISFRNKLSANPFGIGNKLPVMTFQANGRVGIGTLQPTSGSGCVGGVYGRPVLLDVNGLVNSVGNTLTSDRRFKQDIKPIENAMDLVRRLQGTTYQFKQAEFKERNFPGGNQYGFIAQDVEKVMPEIASENSDGYYAVNYTMLIPVLTEAIKEKDKEITELRTEIAELRSAFNDFKAGQAANGVEGYRLEQNAPNPFSQNTVIGYAVPAGTTGARVNVYDLAGRLVKSFNIADQSGQININAGDMSNGLYIYDLQVNGRQILERKMTVVKD